MVSITQSTQKNIIVNLEVLQFLSTDKLLHIISFW